MSDPQSAVSDPRPSMLATPFPKPSLPKHLQEEETVTMVFPRKLSLTLDDSDQTVHFEAGIQEVPVSLAEQSRTKDRTGKWSEPGLHWYLKQQGVRRYEKPKPQKPVMPEITEHHVAFLQSRGYEVTSIEGARTFAEQLDDKNRPGFFAEAADWKPKSTELEPNEKAALSAATEDDELEEEVIDSTPAPDAGKVAAPRGMRAKKRG